MKKLNFILVILLIFTSCVKDKPNSLPQQQVQLTTAKKVYVINEGAFQGNGNGSISLYDPAGKSLVENIYQVQNSEQIGNVAQSLTKINNNFYIVVNNANKIIVCDQEFKKKTVIPGLVSPRFIQAVTNQKAYVSDLFANAVSIVDLNANVKTGSISCPGKTEKMAMLYNKVFVTNSAKDYLYVINTLNDKISDSILVGKNVSSLVIDKNDRVWVLGSGDKPASFGKLSRINAITNVVEASWSFGANDAPGYLCQNKTKDTLFFVNTAIFRMSIFAATLPISAFIENGSKNFYGLGINPNDCSIYAADALDYSQRSQIYIYNADGSARDNFKAGIISNGFYFE